MPKRPREHVLEEESRKRFEQALPDQWVVRKPDPDYAIDAEVEVFGEDGNSTGLVFYVQLKATDEEGLPKALKLSFKKETIEYYHKLKLPTLIVRYHSPSRQLFSRWAHSIDLYYSSPDADNYSVQFAEDSLWGEETPEQVRTYVEQLRDLESAMPLPIEFSLHLSTEFSDDTYPLRLESTLRALMRSQQMPVSLASSGPTELSAEIIVLPTEVRISVLQKNLFTMHGLQDKDDKYNEDRLPYDILSTLGCSLFLTGRKTMALQILTDNLPNSALVESIDFLALMSSFIGSEKSFPTVIRLMQNILESDRSDKAGIVNNIFMVIFMPGHLKFGCPENLQKDLSNLMLDLCKRMESEGENEAAAVTYYNLGNAMRHSNLFTDRQVIAWYKKAARLWEAYLKRDYFWAELGGVLFNCRKYLCSSRFYGRALAIEENPWTMGLCADALLFSGRYSESLACYQDYISKEKAEDLNTEMTLKAGLVESLIDSTKIRRQRRMEEKAFDLAAIDLKKAMSSKKTAMAAISKLEEIYNVDLLCSMMWAHLATLYNYVGDVEQAFHAALATCLLEPGNLEAWWACIMWGVKIRSPILGAVGFLAYEKNGEELIESFLKHIEAQRKDVDKEAATILKALFDGIRSHHADNMKEGYSVARMLEEKDSYQEIRVKNTHLS